VDGTAHVVSEGPTDHYGRWADPRGRTGYAYQTTCGLGEERYLLLPEQGEHTADRPTSDEWDLCTTCFPEGV
jgi:hypothetical protein